MFEPPYNFWPQFCRVEKAKKEEVENKWEAQALPTSESLCVYEFLFFFFSSFYLFLLVNGFL